MAGNDSSETSADQAHMAAALAVPGRLIETHISYIVLTGSTAYKIKKAIRLPFLDFMTLEARRFFCEEELRLNRRLAPALYLGVVPITGTIDQPELNGSGPVLDYAVEMREFDQSTLLAAVLQRGELAAGHIDALARQVAAFHALIPCLPADSVLGDPDDLLRLALDNFDDLRSSPAAAVEGDALDELERWTRRQHAGRRSHLRARRAEGFVRECHGDLHLGNMALVDGVVTIFDCIDFSDRLRWIDVLNEVAFAVMDLVDRRRPDFASRFLNEYLEITGDYAGLPLLPFYLVYRAMVRAKVACLRAAQLTEPEAQANALADFRDRVQLALSFARGGRPALVVMHGLAGCGKTTFARALRGELGAVQLRSDIERKRLRGLAAGARTGSPAGGGAYTMAATQLTYERLLELSLQVVAGGLIALVDAAFLHRWQRELFRQQAAQRRLSFCIVSIQVPEPILRARIARRSAEQIDASEAGIEVLEHQLRTHEPIGPDETADVIVHDGTIAVAQLPSTSTWRELCKRVSAKEGFFSP